MAKDSPLSFAEALQRAKSAIAEAKIRLDERAGALEVIASIDRALQLGDGSNDAAQAPPVDREREARVQAEASLRRLEFVYETTSSLFAAPLNSETRLDRLASMVVPDLADWCLVDVVTATNAVQRRIRTWNPLKATEARALEGVTVLDTDASFGPHHVIHSAKAEQGLVNADRLGNVPSENAFGHLLSSIKGRSYVIAPLFSAGRPVGALTLVFAESARRHTEQDIAVIEDLAARAGVALEIGILFEQLERTVKGREEMVAVVSHDLRNPLAAIRMSASMLQRNADKGVTADTPKHTAVILRAVDRMNALIRDLLDVASIDAGGVKLQLQSRPMGALLAEVNDTLGALATGKDVAFTIDSAEPQLGVRCDPDRLMQVFSNLIGNAVKFTPAGGSIAVTGMRNGNEIRFAVKDTGAGIDDDQLPHVFDRFWRGKEGVREHGAGLGLAIARGIVEAHGGEIFVESTKGVGTTFSFSLPLLPPNDPARLSVPSDPH